MKYIGIAFSPPLTPGILNGTKTKSRRIYRPRTPEEIALMVNISAGCDVDRSMEELLRVNCPYRPGDIIWVREAHYAYGYWQDIEGKFTASGRQKRKFYIYDRVGFPTPPREWSFDEPDMTETNHDGSVRWYKRLARFMPKKYARTFLEITDVKLESLQDITEADAIAEGVERIDDPRGTAWKSYEIYHTGRWKGTPHPHSHVPNASPLTSFRELFESLHGPDAWTDNPWVWVLTFKKITEPENWPACSK